MMNGVIDAIRSYFHRHKFCREHECLEQGKVAVHHPPQCACGENSDKSVTMCGDTTGHEMEVVLRRFADTQHEVAKCRICGYNIETTYYDS